MKATWFYVVLAVSFLIAPTFTKPAEATIVDLMLVLAVDVSDSVVAGEFDLQKQGYVDAFNNALIYNAIQNGGTQGSIAVTLVYWSTSAKQVVPWTLIDGQTTSEAFAAAINLAARPTVNAPDNIGTLTGIGNALTFSSGLFGSCEINNMACQSNKLVIDISGDGEHNTDLGLAQDRADALAIVDQINGLAIETDFPDLLTYYETFVIGGPDSFALSVLDFNSFGQAVGEKLLAEINNGNGPPPDCIPEPATMLLFSSGLVFAFVRRKKQQL